MLDNNNAFNATMNKALKDDGDDFLNTALRKWKFNSKYKRNQILFTVLLVFFLVFGSIFTYYYTQVQQIRIRYDNSCALGTECTVQMQVTDSIAQPIYFYYEIDNFYQTQRRFYQSKDSKQLKGEDRSVSDLTQCSPFVTNADLGKIESFGGHSLNPNDPAIPCGLLAKTYFNDTFSLKYQDGTDIAIDSSDIAWSVDVNYNYKQTTNAANKAWLDVTNQHFMVWMRTQGMGNFKKLWGRIKDDLPIGSYSIKINNQYNSTEFNGQKYVLFTTSTPFGQRNVVLIIAYFSGAFVCFVSIVVLFTYNKMKKDR